MWSLGPIFSKNFSKALREVMEQGQWVKESHCILHCSVASPSPSHSSSGSSSVPRAVWGSGKGHSGSWSCECHWASRMSLLSSECTALLVHRSLCETQFCSELHYIKGGLFLSPPHLVSIVCEIQRSSLPYSGQNDSKLCLFYYWDIYTGSNIK